MRPEVFHICYINKTIYIILSWYVTKQQCKQFQKELFRLSYIFVHWFDKRKINDFYAVNQSFCDLNYEYHAQVNITTIPVSNLDWIIMINKQLLVFFNSQFCFRLLIISKLIYNWVTNTWTLITVTLLLKNLRHFGS